MNKRDPHPLIGFILFAFFLAAPFCLVIGIVATASILSR